MRFFAISNLILLFLCGCNSDKTDTAALEQEKEKAAREARKNKWFQTSRGNPPPKQEAIASDLVDLTKIPHLPATKPINPYPIYNGKTEVSTSVASPTEASGKTTPGSTPYAPRLTTRKFDDSEKIKTALSFNAAPLPEVITVFAELLQLNYQIDGALIGTVTLSLSDSLTRAELWSIFLHVLQGGGAYASDGEKTVLIRPLEVISHGAYGHSCNVELSIFQLQHIGAKETAEQVTPFLSKGVKPLILENRNLLIVVDTSDAIGRVRQLLAQLDQPSRAAWAKMVIPCRNISASRLAKEISEVLPVLGFPVALNSDKPKAEEIQLTSVERLQVIVAAAAGKEALEELGRWISVLDQSDVGEQERVFVYNILNANAEELIKALTVMFPVEGSTMSAGKDGAAAATGTTTAPSAGMASAGASPISNETIKRGGSGNADRTGPANVFEVPVRVFADAINNRLLIRTTPRTYAMVKAILARIDTIPSQVLLQILVVDVALNDSVQFGVEFMMEGGKNNVKTVGGTNYSTLAPGRDQKSQNGGKFWIFNPNDPEEKFGYINALAGKTNVKVISSPQVLITSHREAKISVGSKVPVVNSEITNTQSIITEQTDASTNLIRNIQYLDTGVILKITPHVTRGGRIAVELSQTVSEADANKTSGIDSPIIREQIIETAMSIRDGQTIICGGMIKEKMSDTLSTLPVIGGVPFLRRLVGDTNTSTERAEMMILVSGTIIHENTRLENLVERYQEAVNTLLEFQEPISVRRKKIEQKKGLLETWFIE